MRVKFAPEETIYVGLEKVTVSGPDLLIRKYFQSANMESTLLLAPSNRIRVYLDINIKDRFIILGDYAIAVKNWKLEYDSKALS